jgi:hypothetical protein
VKVRIVIPEGCQTLGEERWFFHPGGSSLFSVEQSATILPLLGLKACPVTAGVKHVSAHPKV